MREHMNRIEIVLALLIAMPTCVAHAETRRALVVGIDDYTPPDTAQQRYQMVTWRNLEGAVNDALAMKAVLVTRGFQENNIVVLTNDKATRSNIIAQFRRVLIDPTRPGDIGVFYVAGHGSQMLNSLSSEPDRLDETLVAHPDPRRPKDRPDIRDKELARLLVEAADRGLVLTAILDNCHSGGLSRGVGNATVRTAPPELKVDAKDADQPPSTRDHGVLVLSAAQDWQLAAEAKDDQGIVHGAFTAALLRALNEAPPAEHAEELVARTRAILQRDATTQDPVLVANEARRLGPLFGPSAGVTSRRLAIPVVKRSGAELELLGGPAVGIAVGAVLARRADPRPDLPPLRVCVERLDGAARSFARACSKDGKPVRDTAILDTVRPGQLFEIESWAAPDLDALRVHIPTTSQTRAALLEVARRLEPLRASPAVMWVEDPSTITPSHVLLSDHAGWWLRGPDGTMQPLGVDPDASRVLAILAAGRGRAATVGTPPAASGCAARPCLFVRMPVPLDLANRVRAGDLTQNGILSVDEHDAQYLLVGRMQGAALEYAWVRAAPGAMPGESPPASALPRSTRWVRMGDVATRDAEAAALDQLALRLAKIRGWLVLPMPANAGGFPYRLALQNRVTRERKTENAVVYDGEEYNFVLYADPAVLRAMTVVDKRYVYVLGLNPHGEIGVFYAPDADALVSKVPALPAGVEDARVPDQFLVGSTDVGVRITPPFGVDTYILITSNEPLDYIRANAQEGVRGERNGRRLTGIEALLEGGTRRRGQPLSTPPDWSIQRLQVVSAPKRP